ncbi:hypothetical protein ACCS96_22210 [Rhizobium ruizarguesonis]|jgi:hypothetical protein
MKSAAPGFFAANFRILSAETSAFCNHAAQTEQVANEGNISIFEREGRTCTVTDQAGLCVDFRRYRKTKITLYKLPNA